MSRLFILLLSASIVFSASLVAADQRNDPREQSLSDTLDLWREGRFEQVYDRLSHRSGMTRERFTALLRDTTVRPACCHLKLNDFRLISEKRTTAKVFARIGMEGRADSDSSQSRELTLDHEEGLWKMRMGEFKALVGKSAGKKQK